MALEPDEERRLFRTRQALLIEPYIECAHICIYERAHRIKLRRCRLSREQFVHGTLALARCEARQYSERLGTAPEFADRPLHKGRAEDLRARSGGEQAGGKVTEYRLV